MNFKNPANKGPYAARLSLQDPLPIQYHVSPLARRQARASRNRYRDLNLTNLNPNHSQRRLDGRRSRHLYERLEGLGLSVVLCEESHADREDQPARISCAPRRRSLRDIQCLRFRGVEQHPSVLEDCQVARLECKSTYGNPNGFLRRCIRQVRVGRNV